MGLMCVAVAALHPDTFRDRSVNTYIRKNLPGQFAPIIANWQHPPTSGYCVTDLCYCMYIVAPNMKGSVIS